MRWIARTSVFRFVCLCVCVKVVEKWEEDGVGLRDVSEDYGPFFRIYPNIYHSSRLIILIFFFF